MATRKPTPDRTGTYIQGAEADRDALEQLSQTADSLIKEAEKISVPPDAKTAADKAVDKAKEVLRLFGIADAAWKAGLVATDETTIKSEAAKAKVAHKDANSVLREAQASLADAKAKAGIGTGGEEEITEHVDEVKTARSAVRGLYRQARQNAREARKIARDQPSDQTSRLAQQAADAEGAVQRALDRIDDVLADAEEAAHDGNATAAERAAKRAKQAQKAAEEAARKATEASEDITTAAEDATTAREEAEEAKAKTPLGRTKRWLGQRTGTFVLLGVALVATLVGLGFNLPWYVVMASLLAIVGIAVWEAYKPNPATRRPAAALAVFAVVAAFAMIVLHNGGIGPHAIAPSATATATTRGDGVLKTFPTLPPPTPTPTPAS